MTRYILDENNSGGSWWLSKAQYDALFAAGWTYVPSQYDLDHSNDQLGGLLGTKDVPYGWRHNTGVDAASIRDAVDSFEEATGENFFAQGCNCCGVPFSIGTGYDADGDRIQPAEYASGADADFSRSQAMVIVDG